MSFPSLTLAEILALLADNSTGDISEQDMRDIMTSIIDYIDPLFRKPGSAHNADSDWEAGLGNWTAVAGSTGTVDRFLDGATVTTVYDRTSRPGHLLVQCGTADKVQFRCDETLADGSMILVKVSAPLNFDTGDNQFIGLTLNDNDTAEDSGNFIRTMIEQDSAEWVVQGNSSTSSTGTEIGGLEPYSVTVWLAISRDDLTYTNWFSFDGLTWNAIRSETFGGALTNMWLSFLGASTAAFAPICDFHYVRVGSATAVDPY
jgi:hypothetical protein